MSEDVTPEWLRLKREMLALVRGAWTEIGKVTDQVSELEERVERIERDIQSGGRSRFDRPPR